MSTVAPARNQWLTAVLAGAAYWIADCGCLAFAFLAVGSPVPWQGLLLAYCAAQLAVNLPITPGGLGVVEGSLTVALVAFGGGRAPTVAAVLLYRVLSFWIPLPTGAGCYLALARGRRRRERAARQRRRRAPSALASDTRTDADRPSRTYGSAVAGRRTGNVSGTVHVAPLQRPSTRRGRVGRAGTAAATRGHGSRAGTEDK